MSVAAIPTDYFQARELFRHAAVVRGAALHSYPIQAPGPNGEVLTIDVAVLGSAAPRETLVISSGLHGVEGFLGSALQIQALREGLFDASSATVRTVLVHALNPYGFAHLRRVNEDNVDLNRNFIFEPTVNNESTSLYDRLNNFLNPRYRPSRLRNALFPLAACQMIRRYGLSTLKQVIAEGQFRFPTGLFFGGTTPCQSTQILQHNLSDWVAGAEHVLHLDIHTGLGDHGKLKLLLDNHYSRDVYQQLSTRLGGARIDWHDASSGAYQAKGTLAKWCEKQRPDQSYVFLCAEFGTYSALRVLQALRMENHTHHWGRPSSSLWYYSKQHLREHFCPTSERWRRYTVTTGLSLLNNMCAA